MKRRIELAFVPLAEGALVLALGGIGIGLKLPLLFASLGPTAYEQIEKPETKSARPYNILVGHYVGLVSGFVGLFAFHAFHDPVSASAGYLTASRIFASVLACFLTAFSNLLLQASQPAAFSTALIVTLGSYESPRDALTIVLAVFFLTVLGEPLRRKSLQLRERGRQAG
ncbi:MAG TPA: HPP family protein [Candidatus Angelobacter sp.]|nr:HPP family protein [Candidatus Angelobacter sp.]